MNFAPMASLFAKTFQRVIRGRLKNTSFSSRCLLSTKTSSWSSPHDYQMSDSTMQLALGFASNCPQQQRFALSKAITLIESKLPKHQEQANILLQSIDPFLSSFSSNLWKQFREKSNQRERQKFVL